MVMKPQLYSDMLFTHHPYISAGMGLRKPLCLFGHETAVYESSLYFSREGVKTADFVVTVKVIDLF